MKKSLLALAFATFGFAATASTDLFDVDYNEVTNALTEVTALEQFVTENEGVTYAELAENNSILIANITDGTQLANDLQEPPLGIPSFLWGCILGWVGIAIVYFVSEDRDETKKALYGCLAWTVVVVVYYIVAFAAVASTASTI
jgi:hypothetical protein